MSRRLTLLLAVTLAGLCLGAANAAQAEDYPEFDCSELLNDTKFDVPVKRPEQKTSVFRLTLPDGAIPGDVPQNDPFSAQELLLKGKDPILARSISHLEDGDGNRLVCYLIIVEFTTNTDNSTKLDIQDGDFGRYGNRLPILLVDLLSNELEKDPRFNNWKDRGFSIPIGPSPIGAKSSNDDRQTDLTVKSFDLTVESFIGKIAYFETQVWNEETVRFVEVKEAPEGIKSFLNLHDVTANEMIVLCGSGNCLNIYNHLNPKENSGDEDSLRSTYGKDLPDANANPVMQDHSPTQPNVRQDVMPLKMEVEVTAVNNVGVESTEKLNEMGGLECLLSAVTSDLFEISPDCSGEDFDQFRKWNALIRLMPDGRWQIVKGARFRDPRLVEVIFPTDQPSTACSIDVIYDDVTNERRTVQLDEQVGTNPQRFVATLEHAPLRVGDGNSVEFTISPAPDPASCGGGVKRTVIAQAKDTVVVELLEEPPLRRAIFHALLLNNEDLQNDIGLSELSGRRRLGEAILEAVESAHARAAATRSDAAWVLMTAKTGLLNDLGQIELLVDLTATQLRDQGLQTFSSITTDSRDLITAYSPPRSGELLKNALLPSVSAALENNIDELTVTLIAPVTGRSELGISDPCRDERFQTLPADLKLPDGPSVQIAVFPLVRLQEGDRVDLSNLRPLSGGLYACRDLPTGLSIYPFFLEPWRPSVDVSSRYATALSDRIADLIDALVSDEEVSK